MEDKELIKKLPAFKKGRNFTFYELSKMLDVQIPTIERWFKTQRINRVYAQMIRERLSI
ncbi:MAG: hypothetical protein KJ619_00890 [Candidatus Omnitrophica bacterium]|nr:hypothetical protein [Candidatus Omnitrophota bacterium]MBU2251777.1 hypothetical protein [Candidatus Omnitrophota bacterium]